MDELKNFAYSTIATAPSPASSGTTIVVASGGGSLFPTAPFNATVWPVSSAPLASNAEIVRVTTKSTDTFTITRAQESSSARSIVVGDQIAATITKKTLTDIAGGEKVTKSAVSLGSIAVSSSWTDVEITSAVARGLVSLFTVTPSAAGLFDVQVRNASSGGGTLFLDATGITGSYSITSPWYVEGDGSSSIWIRLRNQGSATATFTLTDMRIEKFA